MMVSDGSVVNTNSIPAPLLFAPFSVPDDVENFAIEAEIQILGNRWDLAGSRYYDCLGAGVVARVVDSGGYLIGAMDCPWDYHVDEIDDGPSISVLNLGSFDNRDFELVEGKPYDYGDRFHTYRIEFDGLTLRVLIDGVQQLEANGALYLDNGQVGLISNGTQIAVRRFEIIALD
ncbi:MAG: hypothetical protein KC442_11270 [Thermomicrobiales bacterium]|nr:hypothetical protein [Thermomicrobiales bacterium]